MTLDEIIKTAPSIGVILYSIKPVGSEASRHSQYSVFKDVLSHYVGWDAWHPLLKSTKVYDIVIDELIRILKIV